MNAAAIDDHHHLLAGVAKDMHDVMEVLAKFLRITMGHNLIEDAGSPVLYGTEDRQQYATGDAAPGAVPYPGLAFESFFTFDLATA